MRKVSQREGLFVKGLLMQTEGGALGACTCLFHCDLEHEEVMCETGLDYDSTHSDSPHAARQTVRLTYDNDHGFFNCTELVSQAIVF
jgi:hypothetical protein